MKSLLKSTLVAIGLLSFMGIAYATTIPDFTPSTFETYLSNQEGTADTSMVINKGTLNDGQLLSGYQCFVVDSSSPSQEYECGTVSNASASGAIVSNLARGLDYLAGTSTETSQIFLHRRGADVKVSDYPVINYFTRIFNGSDSIAVPIQYNSIATTTIAANRNTLASVGLVQDIAFNGAGVINATANSKGIVQLATTLQGASSTALGSSGASLVIPASSATSTYNAATAPLRVVVTRNNGTIDPNFIQPSFSNATFTGTTTMASTTINGANPWGLLASQTATGTTNMTVNVPPRNNLQIVMYWALSSTGGMVLTFNGDGGNNYTLVCYIGGPGATSPSGFVATQSSLNPTCTSSATEAGSSLTLNITGSSNTPKFISGQQTGWNGSAIFFATSSNVWNNTSSNISSINVGVNGGSIANTSFIKVYGDTSNP